MARMSAVWDRTTNVLAGRAGILATIALLTVVLPSIVQVGTGTTTAGIGQRLIGLVAFGLTTWGTLAMTAVASNPAVDHAAGLRIGARALPRALAVMLVLGIVAGLLFVPGIVLLMRSGFDFEAAARNDQVAAMANASMGGFVLYALVFSAVMIWAAARLILIYPVLANERVSLGAIRRSFTLTRGLALRIVAVLLIYLVVLSVAVFATHMVFGTVFRLALGAEQAGLAAVLSGIVLAVVVAVFTVLQTVFAAQLYVAVRSPEASGADLVRNGPWA